MLPFGVGLCGLEQPLLIVGGEHATNRFAARLGEHLDVVLDPAPLLEPLQHLAEGADVHVDGPIRGTLEPSFRLERLDGAGGNGRQAHVTDKPLD